MFRRGTSYDGEYGFDWVEWQHEPKARHTAASAHHHKGNYDPITKVQGIDIANYTHWYDEHQQACVPAPGDLHAAFALQDEYDIAQVCGADYYVPWLSVLPGQTVKLQLVVEAFTTAPAAGTYLTFRPDKSGQYQVTVNGATDAQIRLVPTATPAAAQVLDVEIKCLKAGPAVTLVATNEQGTVLGQLNAVGNDHLHRLPVRLVYLVKDAAPPVPPLPPGSSRADVAQAALKAAAIEEAANRAAVQALEAAVQAVGLPAYLNAHALNQAGIQVVLEKPAKPLFVAFSASEWAGKFYDPATNCLTDYVYNKLVKDKLNKDVERQYKDSVLDKAFTAYVAKYEKAASFRGVIVCVSELNKPKSEGVGGVAHTTPVDFRFCLIFEQNKANKTTYAHEIAHLLGLEHMFWGQKEQDNFKITEGNWETRRDNVAKRKVRTLERKAAMAHNEAGVATVQNNITLLKAALADPNCSHRVEYQRMVVAKKKEIEAAQRINSGMAAEIKTDERQNGVDAKKTAQEAGVLKRNPFKWAFGSTGNIMDYSSKRNCFTRYQWAVMREDVKAFYGSAE